MVRFNPRSGSSLLGVYVLNKTQLGTFAKDLWNTNFAEGLQKLIVGDGSDCIIGLKWFYGLKSSIDLAVIQSYITLGNMALVYESPKVPVAAGEYTVFNFGSIQVPSHFGDWRDTTLVSYKLYLPFIGLIDLNPNDVVGRRLYLRYTVNITDGGALCSLSTTAYPDMSGQIYTGTCSWGVDIPFKADGTKDALTLASGIVSRVIPGVIMGGAAAGIGNQMANARQAKTGADAPEVVHESMTAGGVAGALSGGLGSASDGSSYSAGSMSPNSNAMGDFEAKLIRYVHEDLSGNNGTTDGPTDPIVGNDVNFRAVAGSPSGAYVSIGDFGIGSATGGLIKVAAIHTQGTLAATPRGSEIASILMEGIYY